MIGIIDYGMGNVTSVRNAFAYLGFATILTDKLAVLDSCSALVLPGVGAFGSAVEELQRKGLFGYLQGRREKGSFILGICLGLQLFFERSEEDPGSRGLAYFAETIRRFPSGRKVPHMGWNRVNAGADPLFQGIGQGSYFYFAHSYYAPLADAESQLARCCYGVDFAAVVKQGNTYGLQFHPEKSGEAGLQLLLNFGRMVESADHTRY
ncbi:MAG: imidazole glycerol phosphate synthase subunit HisH [Bacillota bacterium]